MSEWITTGTAAARLEITESRVRGLISEGLLEGRKEGRDWQVLKESVELRKESHGRTSPRLRLLVLVRDGGVCQDCGFESQKELKDIHVHHITPRADGGVNELSNLVSLCMPCHYKRHNPQRGDVRREARQRTVLVSDAVWAELTARAVKAGSKNAVLEDLLFQPIGEVLDTTPEDGPNLIANLDMSYSPDKYREPGALETAETAPAEFKPDPVIVPIDDM